MEGFSVTTDISGSGAPMWEMDVFNTGLEWKRKKEGKGKSIRM